MALKNISIELTDFTATGWAMPVGKASDPSPDRFLNLETIKAYIDSLKIYVPGTQPSIVDGTPDTLTLNCTNREEASFEPRLSVGTLTIPSDFTVAFSNTTGTLLISIVLSLTGTVAITFPSDVLCSNPSSIGDWTSNTLTLSAGTDDLIEMQLIRYSTNSKWLLKVAEVAV